MAKAAGASPATVQQVWSARGLGAHLVGTFKLSNDKRFEEELVDVVGLYLDPPDNAVVLCMDGMSEIQARDRTQSTLPICDNYGTHDHDNVQTWLTEHSRFPVPPPLHRPRAHGSTWWSVGRAGPPTRRSAGVSSPP